MAAAKDLSSTLLACNIFLSALGAVLVILRLWVRFFKLRAASWDDYFIAAALAASLSSMSLTIAMVHNGYGKTWTLLEPAHMVQALKYSNFAVLVNGFAMAFLKISIGLTLLRLNLDKRMNRIVWASILLSVAVNMLVVPTTLFGCRPLAAVWDRSLWATADCFPRTVNVAFSYTQTVGNILTDLFFSFGPLYYLSRVQLPQHDKWALRAVFMIGLLATICAIAKCTELPKLGSTTDPTYDGTRLTIWVRAELNAGLLAAAIPPLRSLFHHVLHSLGIRSGLRSRSGPSLPTQNAASRQSRIRNPEDDDMPIAGVHGSDKFEMDHYGRESTEAGSMEDGRHGVARSSYLRNNRSDESGTGNGTITKTMTYTVRSNDSR